MANQEGLGGISVEPISEQSEGAAMDSQQVAVMRADGVLQHGKLQYQQSDQAGAGVDEERRYAERKADGEGEMDGQAAQAAVKLVPGVVSVSMPGMAGTNLVTFPNSAGDIPGITMVAFPPGPGMGGSQMQLSTIMAPGQQNIFQSQTVQGQGQNVLSTSLTSSPDVASEDAGRKREMRLLKNREAAKECRRKKKEYVRCLENRVAVLEAQNKTLIEELKQLKDLYCTKGE